MQASLLHIKDAIKQYAENKDHLSNFIKDFHNPHERIHSKHGQRKYMIALQQVANRRDKTVKISLDDLEMYDDKHGTSLTEALRSNTRRYLEFLYQACDQHMPQADEDDNADYEMTMEDEVYRQRVHGTRENMSGDRINRVPMELMRQYEIRIINGVKDTTLKLREVKALAVGGLIKMQAVVTRVMAVKPRARVVCYSCETCDAEIYKMVEGDTFMPVTECTSQTCKTNKTAGRVSQKVKMSKFIKFQELKVQEPAHDVPVGSVPRSMTCIVTGEMTRQVLPGDSVTLSGIFLPYAKSGFAALRGGLIAETFLEVHDVEKHKRGYAESLEDEDDPEIKKMKENPRNNSVELDKLAASIAPEIYGHEDVKKALLLVLVGGVTKNMHDGMRLRGDLHVLLMGDPGVAKSQLLKQLSMIAPRAVYTTGKGSSGVGLTASVLRDKHTGETTLEGGALVLADNGICCIDEFDKMDESDRTAIHEVMEQQTVSIAKAGITCTLNARASVCAAANPAYGRYDLRKSAVANMNLPAALLSRFDLQFLLLDKTERQSDLTLARHVLRVHQLCKPPAPEGDAAPYSAKFIRHYVALARSFEPVLPESLVASIVEKYADLRGRERDEARDERKTYTTPRTLLGMLRMSQALARLRLSHTVDERDFEQALRLMEESKMSVLPTGRDGRPEKRNPMATILDIVTARDNRLRLRNRKGENWILVSELEQELVSNDLTKQQLYAFMDEYEELDVIEVNEKRDRLRMLGSHNAPTRAETMEDEDME